jgi:hypothetical protein
LNKIVADQKGFTEIYKGLDLDWSIQAGPSVDADNLKFGIKGLFFNDGQGEVEPAVSAPAMPLHDD